MSKQHTNLTIGLTEYIGLPDVGIDKIPAKIDTGAYSSAIWASKIKEAEGSLSFILFDKQNALYSGDKIITKDYAKSRVRNSFGHIQERYRVKMNIRLGNDNYKTIFTLANRSRNRYPILLGRSLLRDRFVVDVSKKSLHVQQLQPSLVK
jgi:hypothetical protein